MRLFERERQSSALRGFLRESCEGAGHVVLLGGPAGCGKTALLREIMQAAETCDAACFEVTCSRDEQLVPFGAVRELLWNAARAGGLAARVTDILTNGGPEPGGEILDAATLRVFDELCRIVLACAERNTVVIGIDDVHHADALSMRFFRYLALRIRTARVLLVLGELSTSNWMYSGPRAEIGRMPHARTVAVGPLSAAGIRGLLTAARAEEIGQRGGARHSSLIWAASGGNPLLAHALVGDVECAGPRPGAGFRQALVSCLDRMGPDTLRLACALAVLGTPAPTALLARLIEVDIEQAALIVEATSRAGVTDTANRVRFRHPSVGRALREYLSPAAKAQLHYRTARVLHDYGSDVRTVARYLVKSGRANVPWATEPEFPGYVTGRRVIPCGA